MASLAQPTVAIINAIQNKNAYSNADAVDMSMYVLVAFAAFTVYVESFIFEDNVRKRGRDGRVMWVFGSAMYALNAFMMLYSFFMELGNYVAMPNLAYFDKIQLQATFRNMNEILYDFILTAFSDSSYTIYICLVLSLWCMYCNKFVGSWVQPLMSIPCGIFVTICENHKDKLSDMGISFDFLDDLYQLDQSVPQNRRDSYPELLIRCLRLTLLSVWAYATVYPFTAAGASSEDGFLCILFFVGCVVICADVFIGIWNPITLAYELFDARNNIRMRDILIYSGLACNICRFSYSMKYADLENHATILSIISKVSTAFLWRVVFGGGLF